MPRPTRPRPHAVFLLFAALVPVLVPEGGRAQTWEAVTGASAGVAGGGLVSLAVVTAKARAGSFFRAPTDVRWELLPVPLGGAVGGVLGHRNPDRLWRSLGWGGGGLALGTLTGGAVGRIFWGGQEGTWAGAVVGGATGMVTGALVGALTWNGPDPAPLGVSMSVPIP